MDLDTKMPTNPNQNDARQINLKLVVKKLNKTLADDILCARAAIVRNNHFYTTSELLQTI